MWVVVVSERGRGGLTTVVTYEREESMVLFVVNMSGEGMLLDINMTVVEYEGALYEVIG